MECDRTIGFVVPGSLSMVRMPGTAVSPETRAAGKVWAVQHVGMVGHLVSRRTSIAGGAVEGRSMVPISGLNYKDNRPDALGCLECTWEIRMCSTFRTPLDAWVWTTRLYGIRRLYPDQWKKAVDVIGSDQIGPLTLKALEKTILPMVQTFE